MRASQRRRPDGSAGTSGYEHSPRIQKGSTGSPGTGANVGADISPAETTAPALPVADRRGLHSYVGILCGHGLSLGWRRLASDHPTNCIPESSGGTGVAAPLSGRIWHGRLRDISRDEDYRRRGTGSCARPAEPQANVRQPRPSEGLPFMAYGLGHRGQSRALPALHGGTATSWRPREYPGAGDVEGSTCKCM